MLWQAQGSVHPGTFCSAPGKVQTRMPLLSSRTNEFVPTSCHRPGHTYVGNPGFQALQAHLRAARADPNDWQLATAVSKYEPDQLAGLTAGAGSAPTAALPTHKISTTVSEAAAAMSVPIPCAKRVMYVSRLRCGLEVKKKPARAGFSGCETEPKASGTPRKCWSRFPDTPPRLRRRSGWEIPATRRAPCRCQAVRRPSAYP